ncbi:hypothetical protein K504DRAFT_273448 [Pleomassaria siparia CBS 279.74]|uniref:Trichothecene 3-O-acetyltransferas-like protein n=1 Tax=Pleomassaria siparia CBS 279.74 TaxID=1314801 RepID=A0A6G1KA98_9PLEO|nr:hypothetical protein K504DRAFT_273448 [Pleomassaria siparia CBS 279.74]
MATNKELHLSIIDQNTVRVYIPIFPIFPFPDSNQAESAIKGLVDGLQVTLASFPFLAGSIRLADSESGKLSLTYATEITDVQRSGLLTSKQLSPDDYPCTYEELKREGMPPSAITGSIFCPDNIRNLPGLDDGNGFVDFTKTDAPAMSIQLTFIPGGLILGIYIHHVVMDFSGMNEFWEYWAQSVKGGMQGSPLLVPDSSSHSQLRRQIDVRAVQHTRTMNTDLMSYRDGPPDYVKNLRDDAPCSHRLFVISAERIRKFRDALEEQFNMKITICNIITALFWIHVTRARSSRLRSNKQSSIGIATNLRGRIMPRLDKTYTGNMALCTKATLPIDELTAQDQDNNEIMIRAVKEVQEAVARVDDDWVNDHVSFFHSIEPITNTEIALQFRFGPDLYITSWMHAGILTREWDIPGTSSAVPEYFRRVYGLSDGALNIMPRRSSPHGRPQDPYEVSLRLATEDMDRVLEEKGGLASWAERVID